MRKVDELLCGQIEKPVESHRDLQHLEVEFCLCFAVKKCVIKIKHFGDACRADDFFFKRTVGIALVNVLADFALERAEHRSVDDVVLVHHTIELVHCALARLATVLDFDDVLHRLVGASDLFDIFKHLSERGNAHVFKLGVRLIAVFIFALHSLEVVTKIVGFKLRKRLVANFARAV